MRVWQDSMRREQQNKSRKMLEIGVFKRDHVPWEGGSSYANYNSNNNKNKNNNNSDNTYALPMNKTTEQYNSQLQQQKKVSTTQKNNNSLHRG